jgi:hypothetical protein
LEKVSSLAVLSCQHDTLAIFLWSENSESDRGRTPKCPPQRGGYSYVPSFNLQRSAKRQSVQPTFLPTKKIQNFIGVIVPN